MKVLFAIGNAQKTKNIADRYYEKYGEVLEYKDTFYFRALIEEVKNNKTYDRIVIDEELEQYRTRDLEQLDRVLYNNIDVITDEIEDADIILICADRRTKGDNFVNTLFGRGIYNLLVGDDRNINPLCDMIKKPKTKKEAKQYLHIDTSLIGDSRIAIDEEINEQQMISILNFYEGIKSQPEKYLETFDRIAEQYSRTQLKIILNYLPKDVREVVIQADRYKYLSMQPQQQAQTNTNNTNTSSDNTKNVAKKKSGGLFAAFKKHRVEDSKNVGTVEIPKLVQPNGAIDLSSSTDEQKQKELAAKAKAEAMAREEAELAAKAQKLAKEQEALEARAKAEAKAREQAELVARAKAEAEAREQAELAAKARAEVEARQQAELAARAKAEAAAREQAELAARARREAEARQQAELASKKQAELEAKAKAEVEAQKQAELAAKARAEVEAKQQAELAARARKEAEAKQQAELAARAKAEAEARQQAELVARAKAEAEAREKAGGIKSNIGVSIPKDSGFIVEVKPNPNAPARNVSQQPEKKITESIVVNPIVVEPTVEIPSKPLVEPVKKPDNITQNIIKPEVKVATNVQQVVQKEGGPRSDISVPPQPQVKVEQPPRVQPVQPVKPNEISEQEKKMKEEQEKLAMEQKKIREAQEKLEEERRKLREEQEKLANAQNQLRATSNNYSQNVVYSNVATNNNVTVIHSGAPRMVVLVGANKAGTSFVTNAVAHAIASTKVKTSILDMTRDKSMYYLYNQNDKSLRKKAAECMQRISDGEDCFLDTNNSYLKVYTTLPGSASDVRRSYKHKTIIDTVKNNSNIVIVDADFTTPIDYFDQADEIYVVQDLDLLKMPDTTLFLRELKNRGMSMKKIRIIINKYVKTSLTPKQVVQTLSYYNDPSMSFVDEVLPNKVDFSIIPYNLNNYAKYIDSVCHGVINYKGYSTDFIEAVEEISSKICPKGSMTKPSKKLFG